VSTPIISGRSFEFLVNQRGEFDHLKGSPAEWFQAYHSEVNKTLGQIGTWLPVQPRSILDIGCGLAVVDMVMMQHFSCECVLVDGEDGDGVARKYDVPFGNREVVQEFMDDNSIPSTLWKYYSPEQLVDREIPVFDLVLSLRSWCFHYSPETYLWFVQKHVVPGTRIIVDVRTDETRRAGEWRKQLHSCWKDNYPLERGKKFERMCYIVGGRVQ
jgi:hypothetical protein